MDQIEKIFECQSVNGQSEMIGLSEIGNPLAKKAFK
jgi:hypothetical protein